jgi:DNA-binding MarR family transcriptional regulator
MDPIKDAFFRAKQDIEELKEHICLIYQELEEIRNTLLKVHEYQQTNQQTDNPTLQQAQNPQNPTFQQINSADKSYLSLFPADNLPLYALKSQNMPISTGNEGVPADRQTNQQTNQHTGNEGVKEAESTQNNIQKLSELLNSLDSIKQEVRFKFKKLTSQEMLVFSTIYQLEELGASVDYSLLAKKLVLTESSIRDYIQRIIKKGIPLLKTKENNKKVFISVSKDLKAIATLSTIMQLREI